MLEQCLWSFNVIFSPSLLYGWLWCYIITRYWRSSFWRVLSCNGCWYPPSFWKMYERFQFFLYRKKHFFLLFVFAVQWTNDQPGVSFVLNMTQQMWPWTERLVKYYCMISKELKTTTVVATTIESKILTLTSIIYVVVVRSSTLSPFCFSVGFVLLKSIKC